MRRMDAMRHASIRFCIYNHLYEPSQQLVYSYNYTYNKKVNYLYESNRFSTK